MVRLDTNLFCTPTNQLPLAGWHTIHHHALFTDPLKSINPYDSVPIQASVNYFHK